MKRLFAPWRIKYILSPKEKSCVFCRILKEQEDKKNYILQRNDSTFSVLNLYPYNNGHLMVIPHKHTASLDELEHGVRTEMMERIAFWTGRMRKVLRADGFNIGMNLGRAAGAGIEEHLHFHVVPRWVGDENFMKTIGGVKVIPESLESVYEKLNVNGSG